MTKGAGVFRFQESILHYQVSGNGSKIMLVFHGFGQSAELMKAWLQPLEQHYTFVSLDLFFHGNSMLEAHERPLNESFWLQMLQGFLDHLQIEKATFLGYSMGCKFVLSSWQLLPEKVSCLVLLAPDGILKNGWYQLATANSVSRLLFRWMSLHPQWLFALMKAVGKFGLVKSSILKFAGTQLNSVEKRERAYQVWVNFRLLGLPGSQWTSMLKKHPVPVQVGVGKFDRIIVARKIRKALSQVPGVHVKEYVAGHNDLVLAWMKSQL